MSVRCHMVPMAYAEGPHLPAEHFEYDRRLVNLYRSTRVTLEEIQTHGTRCDVPGVWFLATRPKLFCGKGFISFEFYTQEWHVGCGIDESGEVHGLWIEKDDYSNSFRKDFYRSVRWLDKPTRTPASPDWWLKLQYDPRMHWDGVKWVV